MQRLVLLACAALVGAAVPAAQTTPGYTFANVDSVNILLRGVGGHGAYPQAAKDPIVLAARVVTALQTIVSQLRFFMLTVGDSLSLSETPRARNNSG